MDIKPKTIKLLEENTGEKYLCNLGVGKDFFDTPKAQSIKENNYKLDFIKIKNCSLKDTPKRMKRQTTDWKKIFANHKSDKGLVSSIYKEHSKFNKKKKKKPQ